MDSLNNGPKYGGDAWLELQAFKTRQINRREKLNRHRDLINGIATSQSNNLKSSTISTGIVTSAAASSVSQINSTTLANADGSSNEFDQKADHTAQDVHDAYHSSGIRCCQTEQTSEKRLSKELSNSINSKKGNHDNESHPQNHSYDIDTVECLLLLRLCDVALKLPIDSRSLLRSVCKIRGFEQTAQATVENLLEKFAHQELITIEEPTSAILGRKGNQFNEPDDDACVYVISADHTKLVEFNRAFGSSDSIKALMLDDETTNELKTSDPSNHNQAQGISLTSHGAKTTSDGSIDDPQDPHQLDFSRQAKSSSDKTSIPEKMKGRMIKRSDDVESLLSLSSTREKESKKLGEELLELLSKPTAKERNLLESFRSADGYQVQEFCPKGTKDECRRNTNGLEACDKLHFKKIIAKHTEESLGDCSFLNTCFHMDSCKYVHYEVDYDDKLPASTSNRRKRSQARVHETKFTSIGYPSQRLNEQDKSTLTSFNHNVDTGKGEKEIMQSATQLMPPASSSATKPPSKYTLSAEEQARIEIKNRKRFKTVLYPPQWIQCDLRYFDMSLLGKFSVVMADPPWDIHMNLPYGTMSDDEMRKLNVPALQDEGVIFLWVTGRAMELGRECLSLWGYERTDEILWVKTNQLQRIIRTGRTGHWLNHGKEHCLVGIKGNPTDMNRGLDCDIIVAEVRATSHKPDEIYGIIERLSPGTRKIELFGRAHNVQPNWITLGNQLDGVRLVEPSLIESFKKLDLPYETADHAA